MYLKNYRKAVSASKYVHIHYLYKKSNSWWLQRPLSTPWDGVESYYYLAMLSTSPKRPLKNLQAMWRYCLLMVANRVFCEILENSEYSHVLKLKGSVMQNLPSKYKVPPLLILWVIWWYTNFCSFIFPITSSLWLYRWGSSSLCLGDRCPTSKSVFIYWCT